MEPPLGSFALNRANGFTLRSVPGYVPPRKWSWLLVKYKYPSLDVATRLSCQQICHQSEAQASSWQLTGIRPVDPRVSDKSADSAVCRVESHDSILFKVPHVNEPVAICLKPITEALLSAVQCALLGPDLTRGASISQEGRRDTIQPPRAQRAKVQVCAIGRKGNPIGANGEERRLCGRGIEVVHGLPVHPPDKACIWPHGLGRADVPPALARAEIDNDQAVAALAAAVRDVGYAFARRSDIWTEVEANIVDIAVRKGHRLREQNGLKYLVVREVDSNKLRTAI